MKKVKSHPAIALFGKGLLPLFVEVVGIDGDFFDTSVLEVVEGMSGKRTMADWHQGLGRGIGQGLETGAETGSEKKGFIHCPQG